MSKQCGEDKCPKCNDRGYYPWRGLELQCDCAAGSSGPMREVPEETPFSECDYCDNNNGEKCMACPL